jgi:hypothetical protein
MAFSKQGIQKGLMAGAAMMAGTAAASPRLGGSGHELGPALKTEGGDFLGYLAAAALGALNLGLIVEDDLLEVFVAFGTMVFEDGHSQTPFLFHYNKGVGGKAIQMRKREKHQTPSIKSQINSNIQCPKNTNGSCAGGFEPWMIGILNLFGIWDLVLGISTFRYALSILTLAPPETFLKTLASPLTLPITFTALAGRTSLPRLTGVGPKKMQKAPPVGQYPRSPTSTTSRASFSREDFTGMAK